MPAITLDTVEEAFIAWRKNRSSRIEAIPQALWERVFHIYQDYSQAEICHRLRLNSAQCKKKMAERHRQASILPVKQNSTLNTQFILSG